MAGRRLFLYQYTLTQLFLGKTCIAKARIYPNQNTHATLSPWTLNRDQIIKNNGTTRPSLLCCTAKLHCYWLGIMSRCALYLTPSHIPFQLLFQRTRGEDGELVHECQSEKAHTLQMFSSSSVTHSDTLHFR